MKNLSSFDTDSPRDFAEIFWFALWKLLRISRCSKPAFPAR